LTRKDEIQDVRNRVDRDHYDSVDKLVAH